MMKLTVKHIFDALPVLNTIIRENRKLPGKGAYRLNRMQTKLQPEWDTIAARYNALVVGYDYKRPARVIAEPNGVTRTVRIPDAEFSAMTDEAKAAVQMEQAVPDDKMPEFLEEWGKLAVEEIEVNIEPMPIDQLCIDGAETITAAEFQVLGSLVAGD